MAAAVNGTVRETRESTISRAPGNSLAASLRRTTCDLCRERKVRCDRTKPECLRCQRFGSVCTYPSPDTDAAKIQEALHNLSKRLENAESRLQSQQPSVQCATPISALEGRMPDFNTVEMPTLGFSADASEDADIHTWYWDQPMVESIISNSTLFQSTPTVADTTTDSTRATSSQACSLPQEQGQEPLNEAMAVEQPNSPENGFGAYPISTETYTGLFEAYFQVVQRHLPLMSKEDFIRTLQKSPEKHQTIALKYAVCMAGAQAEGVALQVKEQYYTAARYHLEQAELGTSESSFWTVEAAQALVLVTRFEFEHFTGPRVMVTMTRLSALMSVLSQHEFSVSRKGEGPSEEELTRLRMLSLIDLSLKFQEIVVAGSTYSKAPTQPASVSSVCDSIELERLKINLLTSSRPIPTDEPFGVLCVSLRIAIDAKHHDRMTAAAVAGTDPPSFNFCRDHERIETKIGTVVTKWLTSSSRSALTSGPDCELRVLALLSALGTRVQLFKTASIHGRKSKFLNTISSECREEGISSAIDISDLLCLAEVRRPDKIAIYREASFYLMPPLCLAAEVFVTALQGQGQGQDGTRRVSHRHLEIRQSLKSILQVMDACKNEAGSYNECIAGIRACLESSEGTPTSLRTSFSASASLGKDLGNGFDCLS